MYSTVHYNTMQYDTQEHAEISLYLQQSTANCITVLCEINSTLYITVQSITDNAVQQTGTEI